MHWKAFRCRIAGLVVRKGRWEECQMKGWNVDSAKHPVLVALVIGHV